MHWLYPSITLLVLVLDGIVCPPVTVKPPATADKGDEGPENEEPMGLEYERYLKEVVDVLESDDSFKKKLEETNASDIRSGDVARHLEFVNRNIRSKLDELKRREIDRLRQAMKMQHHLESGMPFAQALPVNPAGIVEGFKKMGKDVNLPPVDKERFLGHLDHHNPNSFEIEDLAMLIKKASSDLEDLDKKRREDFKHYELEKEVERQVKLKGMKEMERKAEEEHYAQMKKKHADHPKLHHPGSKDQLQEVWEEGDGMDKDDFDPKTFFYLHDTNGDGVLDEQEVEALFQLELDKAYNKDNEEDDPVERDEEMNRMREHVFGEIDTDKNKLISLEEFLQSAKDKKFDEDEGWDTLDEEPNFTDEEMETFLKEYKAEHPEDFDDDDDDDDDDTEHHEADNKHPGAAQGHDNLQGQGQGQLPVQHMEQKDPPPAHHEQAKPPTA